MLGRRRMTVTYYYIEIPTLEAFLFGIVAFIYTISFAGVTVLTYISLFVKKSLMSHISLQALRMQQVAYLSILTQVSLSFSKLLAFEAQNKNEHI